MSKLKVFIASSREAKDQGIVPKLVINLSETFDVIPWYDHFDAMKFTLENLLEIVNQIDAVVLVFAKDDSRKFRGGDDWVARDNVVLECGLFVYRLGRERVRILSESDVSLPTDLLGLTIDKFPSNTSIDNPNNLSHEQNAHLDTFAKRVKEKWKDIPPLSSQPNDVLFNDGGIGVIKTIELERERNRNMIGDIKRVQNSKNYAIEEPLKFDSAKLCMKTYCEALDLVENRFWTTTFLSSGFWTNNNQEILTANRDLIERLKIDSNSSIRRLFLLSHPIQDAAQIYQKELIHLKEQGRTEEFKKRLAELKTLKDNIQNLINDGCETRITYHDASQYQILPQGILDNFNPRDSELAIYDEFRVDLFNGGIIGRISEVYMYTQATKFFSIYLNQSVRYFESLWNGAINISEYMSLLDRATYYARTRVNYTSNYLAKYEFQLNEDDTRMKNAEISRVEEFIRRNNLENQISRYLDIGTCTARYPIFLRKYVRKDGVIYGIDNDEDCISFSRALVIERAKNDQRIQILQVDFLAQLPINLKSFDLITCMLGTISHFGLDKKSNFTGRLQNAIDKIVSILNPDGVAIIGTWSDYARTNHTMLSIYRKEDINRLAEWTPSSKEIRDRLERAGLEIITDSQPDQRLEVLFCKRASTNL
jgi:SAM-dependent methyltransferase